MRIIEYSFKIADINDMGEKICTNPYNCIHTRILVYFVYTAENIQTKQR